MVTLHNASIFLPYDLCSPKPAPPCVSARHKQLGARSLCRRDFFVAPIIYSSQDALLHLQ